MSQTSWQFRYKWKLLFCGKKGLERDAYQITDELLKRKPYY